MKGNRSRNLRGRAWLVLAWLPLVGGCWLAGDDPAGLVIATPWPPAARSACAATCAGEGSFPPIIWVELGSERWADACDRRGGVDLILGGPARTMRDLADGGRLEPIDPTDPVAWRQISRPGPVEPISAGLDPREAPATLAEARSVLDTNGWARGSALLATRPIGHPFAPIDPLPPGKTPLVEAVALVRGGRHLDDARRWLAALERQGWITPAPADAVVLAGVDDLLADLLGAALIDARNERRDALMALETHGHPAIAAAAMGQLPPWPPASVTRLRADPRRGGLADALVEQVAPDPTARFWLAESWNQPRRRVGLDLLRQLAAAEGGRLVREPRFRAWLRGEWTAWTHQLYRRVARLAGGYRPA